MRLAQIEDGKVYYIFDPQITFGIDYNPYPETLFILDITGIDNVQEGWLYNDATGEFTEPVAEQQQQSFEEKVLIKFDQQEQTDLDNSEIMLDIMLQNEDIKLNQELTRGVKSNG